MEHFRLHFFKERDRNLPTQATIAFFEVIDGFEIEMDERSVRFIYTDPRLGLKARFLIMPKSQVRDIYSIDAKYLDLNFQLEVPIDVPDYFFEKMIGIAKRLVDRFDYFVYHESFENVRTFKFDFILQIFQMIKAKYFELNPTLLNERVLIEKEKLNGIYRYIDDMLILQKHYQAEETYVPHYNFFINQNKELRTAIEWTYDSTTVLPAYLDYIILTRNNEITYIKYQEFFNQANRYLEQVPGFIRDTYVTSNKNMRKINKALRYKKYTKDIEQLTKINHKMLVD